MQIKLKETGRSMVEMLGVLAVIGVLTIAAVGGYRYAFNKYQANQVYKDIKLIQINLISQTDGVPYEWEEFEEDLPGLYTYFIRRDKAQNDFVLIEAVEKTICIHLNRLAQDTGELTLYTLDNTPMDCSADTQEIVVSFNGEEPLIPCANNNECPNQEGIYCDADEEICQACGFDERLNDDADGCIDLCADRGDEKITSCKIEAEEIGWCCRYDEFCSETKAGECVPSDGACIYTFFDTDTDFGYTTDCSYSVQEVKNIGEKTYETDCSYTVSESGEVSRVQKCTELNEYCFLNWTKPSWKKGETIPTAGAGATGILYGKCQRLILGGDPNIAYSEEISGNTVTVTAQKKCGSSNKYCALNWTKSSWKKGETIPTAGAGATGILYGKCQRLPVFYTHPYFEEEANNNRIFKAEKKCPPKMYCHLQWKDINCTAAGAGITGKVYGACALWDEKNTTCPKPTEDE